MTEENKINRLQEIEAEIESADNLPLKGRSVHLARLMKERGDVIKMLSEAKVG